MEKTLWAGIAVLWLGLIGASAFGASLNASDRAVRVDHASGVGIAAAGTNLVTQVANSTVANTAADRVLRPVIEPSSQGTGELAGAGVIGIAFIIRAARRRHLI